MPHLAPLNWVEFRATSPPSVKREPMSGVRDGNCSPSGLSQELALSLAFRRGACYTVIRNSAILISASGVRLADFFEVSEKFR